MRLHNVEQSLFKTKYLGCVHIHTSSVSGFRFTARTSFTHTSGAFMVTCTRTTQRVSTDNLQKTTISRKIESREYFAKK